MSNYNNSGVSREHEACRIIADGDACPVKRIIGSVGQIYGVNVLYVYSVCHVMNQRPDYGDVKIVDNDDQAADMEIVKAARLGDIVVTGDYGLAAIVLGKGAHALSFHGREYTNENIDQMLFERHIAAVGRRNPKRGGKHTKGPSKRTAKDDERFEQALISLLESVIKGG